MSLCVSVFFDKFGLKTTTATLLLGWRLLIEVKSVFLISKLCFHHPGHVSVIRGNPDLHFEGAGNGPVVITCEKINSGNFNM